MGCAGPDIRSFYSREARRQPNVSWRLARRCMISFTCARVHANQSTQRHSSQGTRYLFRICGPKNESASNWIINKLGERKNTAQQVQMAIRMTRAIVTRREHAGTLASVAWKRVTRLRSVFPRSETYWYRRELRLQHARRPSCRQSLGQAGWRY